MVELFNKFFKEDNAAGEGGVFGSGGGAGAFSGDFYAPGSAIIPGFLGAYTRRGKIKTKKKKRKLKKRRKTKRS